MLKYSYPSAHIAAAGLVTTSTGIVRYGRTSANLRINAVSARDEFYAHIFGTLSTRTDAITRGHRNVRHSVLYRGSVSSFAINHTVVREQKVFMIQDTRKKTNASNVYVCLESWSEMRG